MIEIIELGTCTVAVQINGSRASMSVDSRFNDITLWLTMEELTEIYCCLGRALRQTITDPPDPLGGDGMDD